MSISGDCLSSVQSTAQVFPSKPASGLLKPVSQMALRITDGMSIFAFDEISPITRHIPVVQMVSHATRDWGSSFKSASRTESETLSQTLSGCPSVTDSDVKKCFAILLSSEKSHLECGRHEKKAHGKPRACNDLISRIYRRTWHLTEMAGCRASQGRSLSRSS